jgi:hypothetical protein
VVQNHPGNGKSLDSQRDFVWWFGANERVLEAYLQPFSSWNPLVAISVLLRLGAGIKGLQSVWNHVHLILHWELICKLALLRETALSLLGIKRVLEGVPQREDHG